MKCPYGRRCKHILDEMRCGFSTAHDNYICSYYLHRMLEGKIRWATEVRRKFEKIGWDKTALEWAHKVETYLDILNQVEKSL